MKWKEIGPDKIYRVSDCGRVQTKMRSNIKTDTWRDKKATFGACDYTGAGYLGVTLKVSRGKYKKFYLHRLVATHFIREPRKGEQANHIDGDRWNNHVNNLEWTTPKKNMENAKARGALEGKGQFRGRLTETVLLTIITYINSGYRNKEISKLTGIHASEVSRIRTGDKGFAKFKHLISETTCCVPKCLGKEEVDEVIALLKQGKTRNELRGLFGVSYQTINRIEERMI